LSKDNSLEAVYPKLASQWHPTKNGKLKPSQVVSGGYKKIWWLCSNSANHVWETSISNRVHGYGCPLCRESHGEKEIAKVLTENKIDFRRQYSFSSCRNKIVLPFDFVVSQQGRVVAAIEYQGAQHFVPSTFGSKKMSGEDCLKIIKHRDAIKLEWCAKNDIPLLRISYKEFENINEIVCSFLEAKFMLHKLPKSV
jgi:hypothetical protein